MAIGRRRSWDRFAGMADDTLRSVTVQRTSLGQYEVRNARGATITIGVGDDADFTPVELLLAALGGCTGADVDYITSKRAEPDSFTVQVTGDKVRDETGGNRLVNLAVELRVTFPAGAAGDAAREALPRAARMSHDRLCTVSRTVELGTPVDTRTTSSPAG
jgi:putative redox protein